MLASADMERLFRVWSRRELEKFLHSMRKEQAQARRPAVPQPEAAGAAQAPRH